MRITVLPEILPPRCARRQDRKPPSAQVALEPVASQPGHRFQRAGLLEEVSCAGHEDDFTRRSHPLVGLLIHLNYRLVLPADDEERGGFYVRERRAGEIGGSA